MGNEKKIDETVETTEVVKEEVKKETKKASTKKVKNVVEKLMSIQTTIKAPKNLRNSFGGYNYRNAEGILESVKPYLEKENCIILLNDSIEVVGDRYYVKATASFINCEDGEKIEVSALARESVTKKGMDDSQVTGATSSYARKYALNGLLLLDDTKDADTDEFCKATGNDNSNKSNFHQNNNTNDHTKGGENW